MSATAEHLSEPREDEDVRPGSAVDTQTAAPPDTDEAEGPTPYKWRWFALAVVLGAEIMDLFDGTITGVAGPKIEAALGGSYSQLQWMSAAYTLSFAMLLITGARLGDLFGRRTMFLIGTAGFALTSLMCGLATSPETLIAARAVQGIAAAMMIPQGLGILRDLFPPKEMAAAFGIFGPIMGLGAVAGPIIGGFLVDADLFGFGWRSIFFVNLPVGVFAFTAALRILPKSLDANRSRSRFADLDLTGMALMSGAMVLAILPLVQGREEGWPTWTFVCMGLALPVFLLFVWHETRLRRAGGSTLVELSLFRNRAFTSALVVGLLFFSTMMAFMLILTVYMQAGLAWSAADAAVAMIPWSLGVTVGAGLSGGLLAPKFGRKVLHAGLLVQVVGGIALWFTIDQRPEGVSGWILVPALAVMGIGTGLIMAPFFDIAIAGVTDEQTGSASGVLNAIQQLGGSIGIAVFGTVFFGYADDRIGHGAVSAFGDAAEYTILIMCGVLAATWVAAFLMPKWARPADEAGAGH
ncbi:MFS transporter [Yinghuangia seranimata]|uniref:MFS transporter n=1 Tax=Yinghuangia seranimata TaxID=408067 RepID=UPI00248D16D2|nr:MFS transporter [Yinghuangia seranimata]MDI2130230.1 MFS transporter [Yinghuangia seranimata]